MTSQNSSEDSLLSDYKAPLPLVPGDGDSIYVPMNRSFGRRLNRLCWEAIEIQYNLACLSTLGGAYHLCNHPKTALAIAIRQEMFARKLGSTSVILKAKVFQAVNLGLLGWGKECTAMFRYCKREASKEGWTEMSGFVKASRKWLKVELQQQLLLKTEAEKSLNENCDEGVNSSVREEKFPTSLAIQELQECWFIKGANLASTAPRLNSWCARKLNWKAVNVVKIKKRLR